MTTPTDRPYNSLPLPWIIIHLLLAVLALLFLAAAVMAAGTDILRVYLETSYKHYPVLLFSLCAASCVMNIMLAAWGAMALRNKSGYMTRRSAGAVTLAMAIIFLYLADPFLRMRRQPADPARASARGRFWTRIGPVVQFGPFTDRKADASSSMVIWYFDPARKADPPVIRFGREPLPERMAAVKEAIGDGRRHEFHLEGLSPSTRYYYQVPDFGGDVRSFRTGPAPGSGGSLHFIAVGDTDSSRKGGYAYSYLRNVMRAAANTCREQGRDPDFLVHAGDMVRTGTDLDAWHNLFASLDMIGEVPLAAAPGNHDYLLDGGANFRYFFGNPDYYAIDYGIARIFFIHPFDGPGASLDGPVITTGSAQYRWIRRELARATGRKWTMVVIHIPILSTGDYGVNELLAAQYFELFRKHGVDLVISGHDHNFDSFQADDGAGGDGTIYIVTGTGGSTLDSYIMDRSARRWLDWRHDRNSPHGLYQHDRYTEAYHRYGELSWGYTDVEARDSALSVSFYRWLDLDSFMGITGQNRNRWEMLYLNDDELARHDLLRAARVKQIDKIQ